MLVLASDDLLPFQLPAYAPDLGKQQEIPKCLCLYHPSGRPESSSWLPPSDQLSSAYWGHLRSKLADGRSLSVPLSVCLSVAIALTFKHIYL